MKKILALSLAVSALFLQSAQAVLFRTSQIVDYQTGQLGAPATGGLADNWDNTSAAVTVTNGSGSLILTNLNGQSYLVASDGDSVDVATNFTGQGPRNNYIDAGQLIQTVDTNVYYSFLYRFNNVGWIPTTGQRISFTNRRNSGSTTGLHWQLHAKNVAGQIQLGLSKTGGTTTNYASTNIAQGETVLVVLRQQIVAGAANDRYFMWINPPRAFLGTNDENVITNDVTGLPPSASNSDGTEDPSATGVGRIWVCTGAGATFDELLVGSTWGDVTPFFGQCIPAAIQGSSTNSVTLVEGLRTTMRMFPVGTSPDFQWQISTNGGTTFNNISGATLKNYETPNLNLADSGTKYRGIVNTSCNGSSATSAVITVTVVAATPTPNGVLVDDNFDFGNPFPAHNDLPFNETNSYWVASVGVNLDAITGDMVGTLATNTSALWIGWFVNPTNASTTNVAHLSVGKQLTATADFSAQNIVSNGGGSMRFGLYDYADATGRQTTDGFTGSQGSGNEVRGYMFTMNWGTNFSDNTPISILSRSILSDINLMGTTALYTSLGSGPAGGSLSNAAAFSSGTNYQVSMNVARQSANTTIVTASIVGGGTNISFSVVDTNWAYRRFDTFAIRPNSLETTADNFTFSRYKVQVTDIALPTSTLNIQRSGTNIIVTWTNPVFRLQETTNGSVLGPYDDVGGAGNVSPYTNDIGAMPTYYRLIYP